MHKRLHSLASVLLPLGLIAGCAAPVAVGELHDQDALEVRVSTANRVHQPGAQLRFLVDVTNRSGDTLDLADLRVEIRVVEPPAKVHLRQDWVYRWGREMLLEPGKRLTVPIVPEAGLELPVEHLAEGAYDIVAVINDRFESRPCRMEVIRPDLGRPLRRA